MTLHGKRFGGRPTATKMTGRVQRSLILPIGLTLGAIVAIVGLYVPVAMVDAAVDDAVVKGVQSAEQVKALRVFYSDNVVLKAVKGGAKASPFYRSDATAIPVPTTFILDATHAFSTEEAKVGLVSPYPWPMRAGRTLDDFQSAAWDQLTRNPLAHVSRREVLDGREVLRVAVADRMDAGCVACHNTNPLSPKQDWKVGDVRGLIEIVRPIDQITAGARRLSWQLIVGVTIAGLVLMLVLHGIARALMRPMRELAVVIDHIADGQLGVAVPHTGRGDELGTVARALTNLQDQTNERLRAEAQISHMAHHDALTGLSNRTRFGEVLEHALGGVGEVAGVAVLCLDLDRFKAVNDTLGHPVGDALLRAVADRLRGCVADASRIARLGGDEFAVVQDLGAGSTAAVQLAEAIIERLGAPFAIDGHQLVIGASVGIAVAPGDGTNAETLLKNADLALYRSKAVGRGTFRFFEPGMDALMQARRELELDLRRALVADEFELHYQPLVDLASDSICAFEALLRWRHPTRGMIPPDDFVPLAEETGEIEAIGAWVIRTACREAAAWPAPIRVAVNLSPVQFRGSTLGLHVVSALAASGLPADRLELEITESLMLQDTQGTLATLHEIRRLGVRISMDDFGTGYSSLSYLRKFPFDKIKIDRSFIRDLAGHEDSAAIVRAVTSLGSGLGMATTAEGVETAEQLDRVRAEGCSEVQGYLISPPRPAAAVAEMIAFGVPRVRRGG